MSFYLVLILLLVIFISVFRKQIPGYDGQTSKEKYEQMSVQLKVFYGAIILIGFGMILIPLISIGIITF